MNSANSDMTNVGGYIDNELSPFEVVSVRRAQLKHPDLKALEIILRQQKQAIKDAFSIKMLSE